MAWLSSSEESSNAALTAPLPSDIDGIHAGIGHIEQLLGTLNDRAHLHSQINQMAADLCANAHPSQVNAIRSSAAELNRRWNRHYNLINDRQQRLERALLEMGALTQAHDQLSAWIAKTHTT